MSIKHATCKNCERTFKDDYNFCPYCGQNDKEELTLGVLFYNTINNYFSVDARFFKSFLPLVIKPGYLALRFIEGKRLLYLHPAQMYLFVSVIFFFMFSFIERDQARSLDQELAKSLEKEHVQDSVSNELNKNLANVYEIENSKSNNLSTNAKKIRNNDAFRYDFNGKIDSLVNINASNEVIYKEMGLKANDGALKRRLYAQALKFYKSRNGGSILQAFYDTIPIAMFFLLPIFALILKMLYRKHGAYSHHLVFSFYFFSFLFTAFSIILISNFIYDLPDFIDGFIVFSTFMYLLLALKRFYAQGIFKSFLKTSIITFLFLSVVTPLTIGILGIVAFLFY